MKLHFTEHRDLLYSVEYQLEADKETLLSEMKQQTYEYTGGRGFCTDPIGAVLGRIREYFHSSEFKMTLLDKFYENKIFQDELWKTDKQTLANNTGCYCTFLCDKPGFRTHLHMDNRKLIGSGMCYFNTEPDPAQSTIFYTDKKYNDRIEMPTGFAKGWQAAVTHDAWHEGGNLGNTDRYTLMTGLFFIMR
jgi:hypothetical protein